MNEHKIDILITDICMPQMSGLELYDVIRETWPHTKMIFLTGYLEFDYVYKVHKHARYVLKAEDDREIVGALRETIDEIENDLLLEQAVLDSSRLQQRSKYYERMLLLKELVDGTADAQMLTQEQMDLLGVDLTLDQPVYCVMIRCAAMRQLDFARQYSAGERMALLIARYFRELFRYSFFGYNKNLTYLLLQPTKQLLRVERSLEGICETFQKAVKKNLSLDVAIYICNRAFSFAEAVDNFSAISDRMLGMAEDEVYIGNPEQRPEGDDRNLPEEVRRELSRVHQLLERRFDNLDREGILESIMQIQQLTQGTDSMYDLQILELYCAVSGRVLSYAKKIGLPEEAVSCLGSCYRGWNQAFGNLARVVEYAFRHVESTIENKNEDVVNRIKTYIWEHLDGDTSLYVLSGHVHLCPEHLLRVFKKQEGVTVLQYINDLKLSRARQMLSDTDIQIKDIATKLGFTSAGYFGRFFKSKLGVTPNYYREKMGKLK